MTGSSDVALVARHVDVTYRPHRPAWREALRRRRAVAARPPVVRGACLTVHRGEAVGIVGRNGSGKSTLLRALAGLIEPSAGSVHARSKPVLLGVSAVLNGELTGRQNALLGGTALGLPRSVVAASVEDVLAFAGVNAHADVPLRTYSSGMRARLQFAIASAVSPEILLVDETLAVGDAEFRTRSRQRITELVEAAGSVVFVSHSMGLVKQVCTRALWMEDGQVRADGPADVVVEQYQSSSSATG